MWARSAANEVAAAFIKGRVQIKVLYSNKISEEREEVLRKQSLIYIRFVEHLRSTLLGHTEVRMIA